jgi:chromosome segregation ATPase
MLEKIKEYKEIIAIIVFFLGGFIWLENQYPKKTDLVTETGQLKTDLISRIRSLNCLLEKYMTLTQLQVHQQNLVNEIQELETRKSTLQSIDEATNLALSPAMKAEMKNDLDKINKEISDAEDDLKKNEDKMKDINDSLATHICGKVVEP